jgi:hypothetical protein
MQHDMWNTIDIIFFTIRKNLSMGARSKIRVSTTKNFRRFHIFTWSVVFVRACTGGVLPVPLYHCQGCHRTSCLSCGLDNIYIYLYSRPSRPHVLMWWELALTPPLQGAGRPYLTMLYESDYAESGYAESCYDESCYTESCHTESRGMSQPLTICGTLLPDIYFSQLGTTCLWAPVRK